MPIVTVNPISVVQVKVGVTPQQRVQSTSTFVGATSAQSQIDAIRVTAEAAANTANIAYAEAQAAFASANTKYSANGGTIYGNVQVAGNIVPTVANTYNFGSVSYPINTVYANTFTVDTIDGGTFT